MKNNKELENYTYIKSSYGYHYYRHVTGRLMRINMNGEIEESIFEYLRYRNRSALKSSNKEEEK